MTKESSFGIIPLSKKKDRWEVFLVQHRHGGHWGFPKGHAELNETSERAAVRELKEETNLDVIRFLSQEPLQENYQIFRKGKYVSKRVYYFVAEVEGTVFLQKEEIAEGVWLTFSEARNKLTHFEGKEMLRQVEQIFHDFLET